MDDEEEEYFEQEEQKEFDENEEKVICLECGRKCYDPSKSGTWMCYDCSKRW